MGSSHDHYDIKHYPFAYFAPLRFKNVTEIER